MEKTDFVNSSLDVFPVTNAIDTVIHAIPDVRLIVSFVIYKAIALRRAKQGVARQSLIFLCFAKAK
ncbi:hypothetical protein ACO0K0_06250 [Undibacterium sp. SXout11W]|uniref:hypothetical protein n=1 Tax=Undibacterium sp. SXout11W TaxID=3413050 RepID=UPI003BF07497